MKMKMKRIALLLACLLLATVVLTACSADDPTGTWVLTKAKYDDSGSWETLMEKLETYDGKCTAVITSNRMTISGSYMGYSTELLSLRYELRGDRMVKSDDTYVRFSIRDDELTLYFSDVTLYFTRSE